MRIPPPIFTREHGAWALLLVPILTGIGLAGRVEVNHLYLTLSSIFFFLSYAPAQIVFRLWQRRDSERERFSAAAVWGSAFASLGFMSVVPLIVGGYLLILPIGILAVILFILNYALAKRSGKTLVGDIVGMLALTLGAPAAMCVGAMSIDARSVILWLLNFLFFASGAFYVHMKIAASRMKDRSFTPSQKLNLGYQNLLYHAVMIGIITALVTRAHAPTSLFIVFLPITLHAMYGTVTLSRVANFKRLGLILLGHSILFAGILVDVFS